jgi:hypothetical protein
MSVFEGDAMNKASIFICVAICIAVSGSAVGQSNAWYYCRPLGAYYPQVKNCPAPWQRVFSAQSIGTAPSTSINTSDPCNNSDSPIWRSGAAAAWTNICAQRDEQAQQAAQAKAQQQQQQEAAQKAQQDALDQQRLAEHAAVKRGYEFINSVNDLILDSKDLAARNAKIQIRGIYKKFGDNGHLYGSNMEAYSNTDNYVVLLTDEAQRPLRAALLSYGCESEMGCQIDIGGHMTTCEHTNALMADAPQQPCMNVEVAIVYRPGDQ